MDQDKVVTNLRSCLISCKGGIKLDNLKADYYTIVGEPLPFKQFGYPTLEAFIRNIPEVVVTRRNGELYVEATPSRSTAHLTKLISRQKARRKIRPPSKRWTPPRYTTRGFSPGAKNNNNNNYNGFQSTKNNYVNSPGPFTTSTPGKSNLYTDFSRPILPLMETVVPCPPLLINKNEKLSFTSSTPPISPIKRLINNNVTNPSIATVNQSVSNCKTIEDSTSKVLNDKKAVSSVINLKPKTAEFRSLQPSERLKVSSPRNTPIMPRTSSPPIDNNGHASSSIPFFNKYQVSLPGQISDPRKDLQIRADALNLPPPIYKMYSKKEKHSSKITIYASVKVGTHTFHTYPEDAASEEDAEKIAARLALVNLAKESSSPEVTTADKKLVEERILNIVTKHHSGVFMHLLPEYYCEQYKEALPHNWQRIIEKCADINQEKGVGDSMILCRTSPTLKRSENNVISSKDVTENNSPLNEKVQLNPIGPAAPGKLTLPKTSNWQVYITCVISTAEIWVRFDKYNNNFVEMRKKMTKHYDKKKSVSITSAECVVGDFYAVVEDNYWHRVQCTYFDFETGLATVFFIDEGYDEQYKFDVLHPLDKKFCMLSAQATRVALQELEEFRDHASISEIENHLVVNQMFLAKVHRTKADEYGSYTTVTFYDISKEDKNVDVNRILIDKIIKEITIASNLQAGQLIELYVTHIDENGRVYAQLNSFVRNLVSSEALSQILTNNTTTSLARETITFTKTYFAKWDLQWYRARVTNISDSNKVTVSLLDVGKVVTIPKKDLHYMDEANALHYIPPQAKQIFLHHLDQSNDERLVARFCELVSDTDLLLARIIKRSPSGIPIVEIFKRIGPNNMLASINTSLVYDSELSKANEDGNNNVNKSSKKRLERRNSRALESVGKLNPPTISDIGQYFDVHVTLAAHPGHFIVQPLTDAPKLKTMMIELQEYCHKYDGPPLETVGEGKLYAGKFREDWYRVYVTNIISDNEVSIYFCDFGDVTIVSRNSLQPLNIDFLKLPYQAVKAKLVDIEATNGDWTVNDCVRFKDLVLDKDFVSVVAESMFDHLSPANGTVLGLRLIDVSTEKDIYIDRLLVEEKRAKYIGGFEDLPSS